MKLLAICSALDLRYRLGCTPHWWQLLKALSEIGVDVVAIPYLGAALESLWWRTYENPCQTESDIYARVRSFTGNYLRRAPKAESAWAKRIAERVIRPRWRRHLHRVLSAERTFDAVLFLTVPPSHIGGIPRWLTSEWRVPVLFYDGDAPASLPRFGGFASGFRIYDGADLSEFDAVITNSGGVEHDLRGLGARAIHPLYWAADPQIYAPLEIPQEVDVFFYGDGDAYRERWMDAMLAQPSCRLPDVRFAIGGRRFVSDLGRTKRIGDVPFSQFTARCSTSRINLNITRDAHASVFASSSARIFELTMMGCAVVSNPVTGLETWFDIGEEMLVVHSADEATETYRRLVADGTARRGLGTAARRRCLAEHTYVHRAHELCRIVGLYRR